MRDLLTTFLFAVPALCAWAQAGSSPRCADDGRCVMGIFSSLALTVDPVTTTGLSRTWDLTIIPEPAGNTVRIGRWSAAGMPFFTTGRPAFGDTLVEHMWSDDPDASAHPTGSITRIWTPDASGDIDFSWATYRDLVRYKVLTIDSSFADNTRRTTTRFLWCEARSGEPVLALTAPDVDANAIPSGRYEVHVRYEEVGPQAVSDAVEPPAHRPASARTGLAAAVMNAPSQAGR